MERRKRANRRYSNNWVKILTEKVSKMIGCRTVYIYATLIYAIINLPSFCQSYTFSSSPITIFKYQLPNGLTVLLNPDTNFTGIYGAIAVRAGSKNDPKDATGIAHYLEHMLFKGTQQLGTVNYSQEKVYLDQINMLYDELTLHKDPKQRLNIQKKINQLSIQASRYAIPNEMDRLLAAIGAQNVNAYTSPESIVFYNYFPENEIERWLDLYAHRFHQPVFRLFQPELEIVYEEKNIAIDDYASALEEKFLSLLFKNHPYGSQTVLGTTEHLKNPSLTKMYQFFQDYFGANNLALVLTGNFQVEAVEPLIRKKFGILPSRPVPPFPKFEEKPFNGREYYTCNYSPFTIVMLGFRAASNNHPDEFGLNIVSEMLSNSGKTGILDKLVLEGKLASASVLYSAWNDYGFFQIQVTPAPKYYSAKKAEAFVLESLELLKNGKFLAEDLEAAKNNLLKKFEEQLEIHEQRCFSISEMFTQYRPLNYFELYQNQIRQAKEQDIIAISQKYFQNNYLILVSNKGTPPREKLKKPPFEPLPSNDNYRSTYAAYFDSLPIHPAPPRFIDPEKQVQITNVGRRNYIYWSYNPINNIFHLTLKYPVSYVQYPILPFVIKYIENAGTKQLSALEFKRQLFKLGGEVSFEYDIYYFYVQIKGLENNLESILHLVKKLFQEITSDENTRNIAWQEEKEKRLSAKNEPQELANALNQFLIYGENSPYKYRPTLKQLNKIKSDSILKVFQKVISHKFYAFYTGKYGLDNLKLLLQPFSELTTQEESTIHVVPARIVQEPTIWVYNFQKAKQSNIFFFVNGKKVDKDTIPFIEAFNRYFGEDMSSLLFQQIRELRSLAYSVSGNYVYRHFPNYSGYLSIFVGCQGDKTNETIDAIQSILRNMPWKATQLDAVKTGLMQSAMYSKPFFRELPKQIYQWRQWEYTCDPSLLKLPIYHHLQIDRLAHFFNIHLKNNPICIGIVGDLKDFNLSSWEKKAKIRKLKLSDFFVY